LPSLPAPRAPPATARKSPEGNRRGNRGGNRGGKLRTPIFWGGPQTPILGGIQTHPRISRERKPQRPAGGGDSKDRKGLGDTQRDSNGICRHPRDLQTPKGFAEDSSAPVFLRKCADTQRNRGHPFFRSNRGYPFWGEEPQRGTADTHLGRGFKRDSKTPK
jgi:hypothetical protein